MEDINTKLLAGQPVYSEHIEDVTHIEYAVGMVVSQLKHLRQPDTTIATLIEIGIDDQGLFVSFPINEENMQSVLPVS
ncbi:MAG: hypothetical protein WC196_05665 [Bacilli bacterium]|jgi:2-methylcitrate dehydratase PrpD